MYSVHANCIGHLLPVIPLLLLYQKFQKELFVCEKLLIWWPTVGIQAVIAVSSVWEVIIIENPILQLQTRNFAPWGLGGSVAFFSIY